MESLPTPRANAEVVYLALPRLKRAVCRTLVPSRNVTVPVGLPDPFTTGVTVAVKVTLYPYTEGLVLKSRCLWLRHVPGEILLVLAPWPSPAATETA